jgi:hypothetical protein
MENKAKDKRPFEYIAPFLDALVAASSRSRNVLVILSTASVLAFVGLWNSAPKNWVDSRINTTATNIEYLEARKSIWDINQRLKELADPCEKETKEKEVNKTSDANSNQQTNVNVTSNQPALQDAGSNLSLCAEREKLKTEKEKLNEIFLNDVQGKYSDAKELFVKKEKDSGHKIFETDSDIALKTEILNAEENYKMLIRIRRENITSFRIPFFGTSFDINDLSLVCGLTFTIILIWLRLCFWTELNSTYQVFERVHQEDLRDCYEYASMHLLFTVPLSLDSEIRRFSEKRWRWTLIVLVVIPVLIHILVLWNDWRTSDVGFNVNKLNTLFVLGFGGFFLATSGFLAFSCLSIIRALNRLWRIQREKIIKGETNTKAKDEENLLKRN